MKIVVSQISRSHMYSNDLLHKKHILYLYGHFMPLVRTLKKAMFLHKVATKRNQNLER